MLLKPLDAVQTARTAARTAQQQHATLNAFISKVDIDSIADGPVQRKEKQRNWRNLTSWRRLTLQTCAVKDNIATALLPTTCASGILQNHQSPFNASVIKRLGEPGGPIVTGKTNMDEFGMGSHSVNSFFGPVIAPERLNIPGQERALHNYSVGGSSGGSAVAVETDQSQVALGTDTGGSVRLPAAYTGTVGFKPSYGLISRWGVVPYANSLDTVGILAASALQVKGIFLGIVKDDPLDPTSLTRSSRDRITRQRKEIAVNSGKETLKDLPKFKIGVPFEYNIKELHPGIRAAWQNVLKVLQERGCTVVPISLPTTRHALSAYYVLAAAEAMSNLAKYDGVRYGTRSDASDGIGDVLYSETRGKGFGEEVKRRILLGSYTLSSEAIDNYFLKAQKVRRLIQRDFDRVFSLPNLLRPTEQFDLSEMEESIELDNKLGPPQVDFIICPTAPTPPPSHAEIQSQTPVDTYMNDVFTVPASLAGLPAISIPVRIPSEHAQYDSVPAAIEFAGIQIIGQHSDDIQVLNAAIELDILLAKQPLTSKCSETLPGVAEAKKLVKVSPNDVKLALEAPREFVRKRLSESREYEAFCNRRKIEKADLARNKADNVQTSAGEVQRQQAEKVKTCKRRAVAWRRKRQMRTPEEGKTATDADLVQKGTNKTQVSAEVKQTQATTVRGSKRGVTVSRPRIRKIALVYPRNVGTRSRHPMKLEIRKHVTSAAIRKIKEPLLVTKIISTQKAKEHVRLEPLTEEEIDAQLTKSILRWEMAQSSSSISSEIPPPSARSQESITDPAGSSEGSRNASLLMDRPNSSSVSRNNTDGKHFSTARERLRRKYRKSLMNRNNM